MNNFCIDVLLAYEELSLATLFIISTWTIFYSIQRLGVWTGRFSKLKFVFQCSQSTPGSHLNCFEQKPKIEKNSRKTTESFTDRLTLRLLQTWLQNSYYLAIVSALLCRTICASAIMTWLLSFSFFSFGQRRLSLFFSLSDFFFILYCWFSFYTEASEQTNFRIIFYYGWFGRNSLLFRDLWRRDCNTNLVSSPWIYAVLRNGSAMSGQRIVYESRKQEDGSGNLYR